MFHQEQVEIKKEFEPSGYQNDSFPVNMAKRKLYLSMRQQVFYKNALKDNSAPSWAKEDAKKFLPILKTRIEKQKQKLKRDKGNISELEQKYIDNYVDTWVNPNVGY